MLVLFIGDVVGRPGRTTVGKVLPRLKKEYRPDVVVANAENAAGGIGLTPDIAEELLDDGVHVITLGNHVWKKKELYDYLDQNESLVRPLNFPGQPPGRGSTVYTTAAGELLAVINAQGRVFFETHVDCPFRAVSREVQRLSTVTPNILVDFHAEATSEKSALGWFLDGQVSAVIGTHTHVQTADERLLPKGTGFITDVGMTGPINSVIGIRKEEIIQRFLTQMPVRFEVASGPCLFSAVLLELDGTTGRCRTISRLLLKEPPHQVDPPH